MIEAVVVKLHRAISGLMMQILYSLSKHQVGVPFIICVLSFHTLHYMYY